jgi:biotin carboxylase
MDRRNSPEYLRRVIRRSCGDPRFYDVVVDKRRTLEEAAGLGIRCPAQAPVAELESFAAAHGYPLMIKMSVGMAGLTVRVCPDKAAAQAAIDELGALALPPYAGRASLMVQSHVDGYPASMAFVALEGRVLDGFIYRSEETLSACGPASLLRRMAHPQMEQVVRRLVAHFGFSGFGGFDFMVEHGSGEAYLLEMNPRLPNSGHLGEAFGHDLPGALYAALTGSPPPLVSDGHEVVALFPHEWWRDASSPHLRRHFADMPWDDPGLLAHALSVRNP